MRKSPPALLTALLLSGCAASTPPVIERPRLPDAPADYGAPVDLPAATIGKDMRVFALENRRAAILANRRLENDAAFYAGVTKEFGQ